MFNSGPVPEKADAGSMAKTNVRLFAKSFYFCSSKVRINHPKSQADVQDGRRRAEAKAGKVPQMDREWILGLDSMEFINLFFILPL